VAVRFEADVVSLFVVVTDAQHQAAGASVHVESDVRLDLAGGGHGAANGAAEGSGRPQSGRGIPVQKHAQSRLEGEGDRRGKGGVHGFRYVDGERTIEAL